MIDYSQQTTLITGASSGIGAEFARQLAARGSNLVLVARRRDRLDSLAASLPSVRVDVIELDLTLPGAGATLVARVADLGITVTSLINNAGFGTAQPFRTEDPARIADEIALNVGSVVDISRAFINGLMDAGTGVLVNVSSVAGYFPGPNSAVYSATKAFVLSFTEALWFESRASGLRVLSLAPGATRTEFFEVIGSEDLAAGSAMQTSAEVVGTALRALDRRRSVPSVVSGRRNSIAVVAGRLLSRRRAVLLAGSIGS